ncbi:unnamed protein product [Mytilus coruscus]|uniref:Fibronectin type-III domain-containing protein n=1 Tax=Mytilus coruscus TaxID=42192 RepID=A0A6J8CSN9_MYTCO|nr:unnamed protein product [Mytilus coruscus]
MNRTLALSAYTYTIIDTGKIYKVFYKDDKKTYVSSIYSASLHQDVIWSMKQHEGSVYVGTDTKVQQINVINCEQYRRIDSCVKDPHCAWINKTNLLPETEFNIKCRPLTYIQEHQLTNKEGVYTHINYNLSMDNPYTGPPDKPKHFQVIKTTVDTIYLQWLPGNKKGYDQTFVFDYQIESASSWSTQEYNPVVSDKNIQTYQLTGLANGVVYRIRMSAKNIIGSSQHTATISISTASTGSDSLINNIPFVITISVLVIVLIVLVLLVMCCKLYYERKTRKPNDNQVDTGVQNKGKPLNGEVDFRIEDEKKSNNLKQIKNVEERIRRCQLENILCDKCRNSDDIKLYIKHHEKPMKIKKSKKRLRKMRKEFNGSTRIKPTTLRRYVHTDASDDAVQDVVKAVHKAAVQKTVKKNQKLDDFDKGVVRRTIYDLHKKSQSLTMPSLQEALKKKDIDVSISTVLQECVKPKICVGEGGHRSHENDISSHLDPDSRVPNTSSNKSEISAWLEKSIVQYDKKMKKAELLDLVKQHKPLPRGRRNDVENDNDFEDSVSDTINDDDEILCNTCGSTEPPKPIQKDKYISWFHCDACDQWVHNRCCTKPALAKNVCLRCFSIFNHRNLSEPLISPLEEMEQ